MKHYLEGRNTEGIRYKVLERGHRVSALKMMLEEKTDQVRNTRRAVHTRIVIDQGATRGE